MFDVSLIIINYNTKKLLCDCIESIYKHTINLCYEVIVVDNNSSDDTCEVLPQLYPDVKLIKNDRNAGFGAANNLGSKYATGKYLFLLNSDTVLLNNAIKILFDYMERSSEKIGISGGTLYNSDLTLQDCYGNYQTLFKNFIDLTGIGRMLLFFKINKFIPSIYTNYIVYTNSYSGNQFKIVDYVIGADLLIRKDLFDKVGQFDEKFFLYFEEVDLSKRVEAFGWKSVIVPEAKILHYGGKSSNNSFVKAKRVIDSNFYFFYKHSKFKYNRQVLKLLYTIKCIMGFVKTFDKDKFEILKYVLKEK